jgi:hypothetical protein
VPRRLARQARARAAIAQYSANRDERLLSEAFRFIQFCRSSRIELARSLAAVIEAAVCRGYHELAPPLLQAAEDGFRSTGFAAYATAACYRRGVLIGGTTGARLKQKAETETAALGITDPARYSAMLLGLFQRKF